MSQGYRNEDLEMPQSVWTDKQFATKSLLDGFNWGAFSLTCIWGAAHKCNETFWIVPIAAATVFYGRYGISFPLGLTKVLIPYGAFVMLAWAVYLGFMGNRWAWSAKNWRDYDHFRYVQNRWKKAGFIFMGVIALLFVLFNIFTNIFLWMILNRGA